MLGPALFTITGPATLRAPHAGLLLALTIALAPAASVVGSNTAHAQAARTPSPTPAPGAPGAPGADAQAAYNSPQYKDLVQRALQEYELGHWAEARVFFNKAHALAPNARTLRGLALVCYESRHYVEASQFGEQALASQVQPLTAQMRPQLQQFLDQAKSFIGYATITTKPADAELRIDGATIERPADGKLALDAGTHELVVSAAGYDPATRQINVEGGSHVRFDIALSSDSQASASAAPPPVAASAAPFSEPPSAEAASSGSIAPWVVVGASAAVAVAGGVMLGLASADKSKVENVERGTPWSEVKGAYERAPTFFAVGWTLVGVGVAGVATGLVWKFALEKPDRAPSAALHILPGGLAVSGQF
ncbi:MAG: hypothetical protein RL701_6438 [Pseudomonadota bacterium]|jgi:hypothetical protein